MEIFGHQTTPLDGSNLIEASAGTGKTHTITGLFLRMVLEKHLSVNEILTVTFTEAATDELRDRIRNTLYCALRAFATGEDEAGFLESVIGTPFHASDAVRRLEAALRSFDRAAIYTIHGFCARMLHENAFESGNLFDTALMTNEEPFVKEVVADFWRKHFYLAPPLFVRFALAGRHDLPGFFSLVSENIHQPAIRIIPHINIPDTLNEEHAFRKSFQNTFQSWPESKKRVKEILLTDPSLNRSKYRKNKIPFLIEAMDSYLRSGADNPMLFPGFEKFTARELERAVKKGFSPPLHPFFEICDRLAGDQEALIKVYGHRLMGLQRSLFDYVEQEMGRRKQKNNVHGFYDLLNKVYEALQGKHGEAFARAVRGKYKAALIDEFQDTDPLQYAIFNKIFAVEGSTLFFIGDPKQAIYGFRGADIYAYLAAAREVPRRYTLGENWRAEKGLVTAANTLFTGIEKPFVHEDIAYHKVEAAQNRVSEALTVHGEDASPFILWFVRSGDSPGSGKPMAKQKARQKIARAVASEISRLLMLSRAGKAFIGERPLREGDMAVLVRRHREARLIQKALYALRIPSVLYSTDNLFDSGEAEEMERLLTGLAGPNRERLVKAALTSSMFGLGGEDLAALLANEAGWDKWMGAFRKYHDVWHESGFMRMFRLLIAREGILPRLMAYPDGERRATNLLHLVDVLHKVSVDEGLGVETLIKWLSDQRSGNNPGKAEHPLRLESDEAAIQIVTVHKSKGLEYPVVFSPFSWDGSRLGRNSGPFQFHNPEDNLALTLDLGSDRRDAHLGAAEMERLAENIRLLYVTLTRAKSRCYLIWGRFNGADTSAPAYLIHSRAPFHKQDQQDLLSTMAATFKGLDDQKMLKDMGEIVHRAKGAVALRDMPGLAGVRLSPPSTDQQSLTYKKAVSSVERSWRISSFSSLTAGSRYEGDAADRDAVFRDELEEEKPADVPRSDQTAQDIFTFPKGAMAGTFFHQLMEQIDFRETDRSETERCIAMNLAESGYDPGWLDTLHIMIQNIVTVPLSLSVSGLELCHIAAGDRLNELAFYFPLKRMSSDRLKDLFRETLGPVLETKSGKQKGKDLFSPCTGFMRGFIDLVFAWQGRYYIIDWKSNYLGDRVGDYHQAALARSIKEESYSLQYHLYTLALDQYLRLRLPGYRYDQHFGGVFYVFLRGVDAARGPEFGIYEDVPPRERIIFLREHLIEP